MKAVTEFNSFKLNQALKAKTDLAAAGKTPEEIQASLGETFKLEGDKLKYFVNAVEVAGANTEGLTRVLVMSAAEGEKAPAKSQQFEELHYVPEFQAKPKAAGEERSEGRGGRGGRGGGRGGRDGGRGGPKESPWGLSPEQKAAKKGAASKPS